MAQLTKRKRSERAHRYRVLAQQLDFHLSTDTLAPRAADYVRSAKQSLLDAASILDEAEAGQETVKARKSA
jgi:hypothetical protein